MLMLREVVPKLGQDWKVCTDIIICTSTCMFIVIDLRGEAKPKVVLLTPISQYKKL
jgi:hypothetical protein